MSIKINKDLAKFIKGVCKDEGLDRTKYINKLLWYGIKVDFKEGMEKKAEAQEEKAEAQEEKAYLLKRKKKKLRSKKKNLKRVKPEFGKHDFSKGIWQ